MSDRQLIADLLSALEYHTEQTRPIEFSRVAIEAAREYLRKPAQQPYGWKIHGVNSLFIGEFAEADAKAEAKRIGGTCIAFPLYTSPPASKPWVGLTDKEIEQVCVPLGAAMLSFTEVARAIEAKLKEKNA